jgi:hypothetical protein
MAETDFKHDVFISYSSANKDWARKDLRSALQKAGLKVCIDFRDFEVGKPAIKNMRDGNTGSRHTLLVLTEAYLNSGWEDFENMLSQTIDPVNRKTRIVPLLKEKCKLPLEIGYLTYVKFLDPDDWDIAWKQLFDALGKSDASTLEIWKPFHWFFGHRYGDLETFTGRAAELDMLNECLNNLEFRHFSLPRSQHFICVVQPDGFLFLLPCVFAGCERRVIDKPAQLKRLQEFGSLTLGWRKAKLIGFHSENNTPAAL